MFKMKAQIWAVSLKDRGERCFLPFKERATISAEVVRSGPMQ